MICPFCKEEIKDGAIKCKHCGSMLDGTKGSIPNRVECPFCKESIDAGSTKCEHCGGSLISTRKPIAQKQPFLNRHPSIAAQVNQGAIGCIIGGAFMMISPILPWATAVGGVFSATGFDKLGVQAFLIILFGLGILYGGIKIRANKGTIAPALLFNFISVIDTMIIWSQLKEQASSVSFEGVQLASIGVGYWLYFAGVVVSQISIFYAYFYQKSKFLVITLFIILMILIELLVLIPNILGLIGVI